MNINLCDLRGGKDIDDLIKAIQSNPNLTSIDLRDNFSLDDAALQPLLIALASGSAPKLTSLRLGGTGIGVMSKNMCQGLSLMRKDLVIET
mmetsp:Transcript_26958/g.31794  ORF Transcript_26958/g.31794 Transcript_26958/m.31794 type:complete len:91 (+) Transcript_26958:1152-1424(+)